MTAPVPDRRTGGAAVAGGLLLAASVAAELVHPVQEPDGALTNPALFAVYLTVWTAGAAAIVVALSGLRAPRRLAGMGRAFGLIGAASFVAFGLVVVASALATGAPLEAAFLAFALGLLLLAVGSVLLGLGLHRSGAVGGWWVVLPVAGAGALVALLVEQWHDAGMFVFFAGWVLLGAGCVPRSRRPADRVATPVG
jgi:hypothetical protein